MLIFRLIIAIAVILALFYVYRRIHSKFIAGRQYPTETKTIKTREMVRCEQCGLHIVKTEAVEKAGHFYCCPQHADKR